MIDLDIPDVNVVFALLNPSHAHHRTARQWFTRTTRFATTPLTESGFLRLSLNPSITGRVISTTEALDSLRSMKEDHRVCFLPDDSTLSDPRIDLISLVGHKQVSNLHLTNLAKTHNARLVTLDARLRQTLVPDDQEFVHPLI